MKNTCFIFLATILFCACEDKHSHQEAADRAAIHAGAENLILLTAAQAANAGIQLGSFTRLALGEGFTVNAELVVHPEHRARVSAFSDGIVAELRTSLNATVVKGQLLATLRKPDLLDLQQQFLENKDRMVFLQAEYDRYRFLKDADATAAKNFQKADADLKAARTTEQVLSAKLRLYQIDPEKLSATNLSTQLALVAPVSGIVTAVHTHVGAAVQPGIPICDITDLSQLHADLWIFEKDLPKVTTGQRASLIFPADRTRVFPAVIYSIDKVLDPEKRAVRAHARLEGNHAGQGMFLNGAFLEARITTSETGAASALPEAAVVQEGEADFIFILEKETKGQTEFRKVPVQRGVSQSGFVVVKTLENVPEEARVVVNGAYYVSAQGLGMEAGHEH